ncbi:MAG: hypothetical protein SH847_10145 [Roseiflexaceae bacterium]|nr:hypothetical protein [Roseiflexaceae bacterium]
MFVHHQNPSGCTLTPPLDDLDLIAALDGVIDVNVRAHLQACSSCARRANDLAIIQQTLQQRFYRMFCPSSEDLLAFQQRMINPDRYISIANHLHDCQHCTNELRMLEQAATNTGIFPSIGIFPTNRIALRLEKQGLFPAISGAPSNRSYGSLGDQYIYRADRIRLMLSIERTFGRPSRSIVTGKLSVGNARNQHGMTASILSGEHILGCSLIDTLGCFTIEDVPSGNLTLSLRLRDYEVVVDSLRV